MLSFEHGTLVQSAYLAYSPEWFWSYFSANDYSDAKVWIASPRQPDPNGGEGARPSWQGDWRVEDWEVGDSLASGRDFVVVAIGEKGRLSTNDRVPRQEHYRAMWGESEGRRYESPRRFEFQDGVSRALLPWR